ncbi:MAG: TetR/AcrR family transcriptional regulator [Pseudomonadota bacterium]
MPETEPRKRLSSDARQREIVAAVVELAQLHGPDAITTQAIAEHIGLTQGAIFRHFSTKEAIWLAVFAWVREALGTLLDEASAGPATPVEQLERIFLAHTAFIARHPGVPRILFHELQTPGGSPVRQAVRAMVMGYRQRVSEILARGKADGTLCASLDEAKAAGLLIGAVQGLVIQSALREDPEVLTRDAEAVFAILLHGFKGRCP